ncbi:protein S-acyltransferase 10-like [Phragmites australis]|uniref:protein S-acyltransferase 10-like n=1 Tax=Phragmites australis TaxID=29695 RepID=UPI002D78C35A|nr:protein S-acyltransferase 10-like [Phragmites australis]
MASSSAAEPGTRLSDRTRRSSLGLRVMVFLMHVVFVGAVFILDPTVDRRIHEEPWYIGVYGMLVLLTLVQYFYTAGSSPGYVIDMMRADSTMHATFVNTAALSKQSSSRNASINSPTSRAQLQKLSVMTATSSWPQLVMDLYPLGSSSRDWTCTYCRIIQPPRTRHCHDCDKCVLQFDHHCIWLGTCIGKKNHCRFWWYIFEETVLCIWTVALYIESLRLSIDKAWWKDFVGVIMLAVLIFILIFLLLLWLFHSYIALTNQTTYEVARRKRIFYLRGVPDRVHPFSKGLIRNIYDFCSPSQNGFALEAVPSLEELEASATRYTCRDIICCRCC